LSLASGDPEQLRRALPCDRPATAVVIFAEISGEVGGENADIWKLTEW